MYDYRNLMLCFRNIFCLEYIKRKAGVFKSSHFKTLSLRDGLVWTEGLAIEIKI